MTHTHNTQNLPTPPPSVSYTHSHKRKTHSGQQNFEESAEWFGRQPDPLNKTRTISFYTHTHKGANLL